jgi:LacI family transcriptional regulator
MGNRVTIQDIADSLGLSRNTVSKALNNSDGLAESTRAQIIQRAVEMGYKQFAYASAVLGIQPAGLSTTVLSGMSDKREVALLSTVYLAAPHFSSLMLDALQNELSLLGFTLNSHRVSTENLADLTLPMTFDKSRVAAIICVEMFDYAYDEMLCEMGIPTLFVDGPSKERGESLPSDQLYKDNTTEILHLVHDMIGKGYRRIGFIGNHLHCQSFFERYAAFRTAMMLARIPVEESYCIPFNFCRDIQRELAGLSQLPEFFICANDFVAIDALQALKKLDYDVPRDVLLAGFDDSAESRICMPPLTTIHIHTQVMAYSAIQLLRTRMKEPNLNFRQIYTETNLIWRESTERSDT